MPVGPHRPDAVSPESKPSASSITPATLLADTASSTVGRHTLWGPPRAAYNVLQEADVSLLILSYLRRPTQMALIDTNTVLRASVARALCIMLEDAIVETVMPPPRFTTFVVPAHKIGPKLGFTHALDMLSFASSSSLGQENLSAHIMERLMHHAPEDAVLLWPRECPIGEMISRYYEQPSPEHVLSFLHDGNACSILQALCVRYFMFSVLDGEEGNEYSLRSILERVLGADQLKPWAAHNFDTLEIHRVPPLVHGVDSYAMKRIAEA